MNSTMNNKEFILSLTALLMILIFAIPSYGDNTDKYYQKGKHYYFDKKDYAEALVWFRKAAEQGHSAAYDKVGWIYQHGEGVERDYKEAVKWYRKAAEAGNANGQNNLGFMLRNGWGVSKDYKEAMKWFRSAASNGSEYGDWNVGKMYLNGWGVQKDESEAVKWFRKAANAGLEKAHKWLKERDISLEKKTEDSQGIEIPDDLGEL